MGYFYLSLFTALTAGGYAFSSVLDEKQCSKFDYEYKVLERIIFIENKNAALERKQVVSERKNEELNEILKEQRLEMERLITEQDEARKDLEANVEQQAKTENETFQKITSDLEQHRKASAEWQGQTNNKFEQNTKTNKEAYDEIKTKFDTNKQAQDDAVDRLRQSIADIPKQSTSTSVAFSAIIAKNQKYSSGNTIIFDHVWTNNGEAYNPSSGIFTAPKTGTYLFSLTLQVIRGHADVFLMKGTQLIVRPYINDKSSYDSASATSVMNLVKGDTVYAKYSAGSSSTPYTFWYSYYCIFSGVLFQ